ncbi:glycosyltransferase family 4 protein [Limnospira fusiformis KN01]|uniref:glycosyltransferase family 4 protein n=1 Tax=Limnospira TaxID=2596745 RepID=UPI001658A3D3|nr:MULTISPECIES: glycosyltransferase family 4 protein [Limnospira]MDT9200119.1 glycosyltransferase family 4 protein [Limnospira sp. PMC 1042.18]ULB47621.1 glycosyltransferase family 4 protein [Limnospira fusiformis KN01]
MEPIKVLHIIPWLCNGGASRATIATAKYSLKLANFQHSVASLTEADPFMADMAIKEGLSVVNTTKREEICSEMEKADIVHIHYWNNPQMCEFLRSELPATRLLIWFHIAGEHPPQVITRDLVDYADFAIPCNPYSRKLPVFENLPPEVKLKKVGMVYDAADFARVADVQPKPHDTFNVGYIGSVSFSKMHRNYVSMSAAANIPHVKFVVCGGGIHNFLKQEAEQLGASEKFNFRGFVEDIKSEIEKFDVYGYPLCEDTYAAAELNLQEVMYGGVPPVVFPHGGIRSLVMNNYTGLVVDSELEYSQALEYLYHHPEERSRLGDNAREYAKQIFGAENAAKELNPIYEKLMELPKQTRQWGFPREYSFLDKPVSILDVVGVDQKFLGSQLFVESIDEIVTDFSISMTSQNIQRLFKAEKNIAQSSTLLSRGEGSFSQYADHYPEDGYLRLWRGLVMHALSLNQQAISEFAAAIENGCNHWRVFWYLAQVAAKIDALDLAQRALFDVLNFAPDFAPAQQMLQGIEAAISEQSQALDHLNLKDINLIVFPDWNQPEDSVAEDLAQVIKAIATHPDKSQMCLLIDNSNISDEQADIALSSIIMGLLMEEDLQVEGGPEIQLLGKLTKTQWVSLINCLDAKITLESENKEITQQVSLEGIQEFQIDYIKHCQAVELENGTWELFKLSNLNFIIFPDWSQPEETVGLELQAVIKTLVNHPDKAEMTLLIDNSNITPEEADLVLSSVAMNLLMEEEIEFDGGPEIVLIGELSPMQWSALMSKLQGRIKLDHENQEVINNLKADIIPVVEPDNN